MTITQEQINDFFKRHFSQFRDDIAKGTEVMLVQDETLEDEDNEIIDYLEYNCISYSNEEILEMLDAWHLIRVYVTYSIKIKKDIKMKEKVTPKVGDGATYGIGSDCYACTVIGVSRNEKEVTVQFDEATPAEGYDYYRNQVYNFKRNPAGQVFTFTWRKRGVWVEKNRAKACGYISFNGRRQYSDPSF